MLFDIRPKTQLKDLFDREKEIDELRQSLELGEPLVVIYGVRRVGKTSLLRACLNEFGYPYVLIDVREIFEEHGYVTRSHLYEQMARFFTSNLEFFEKLGFRIKELLKRAKAFQVSGIGIEVNPSVNVDVTGTLGIFNDWARRHDTRFVVAFDEAQYLRFSGATRYDGVFAWSYDNLEDLTIIVTGSEVGVLRDFLKLDNPKAPLYGRYVREIKLGKFTPEQSREFLKEGFNELGVNIPDHEIGEAVNKLDGIPGWLTLYGYYHGVQKLDHRRALEKVFETGSKLIMEELEKIIAPSRQRYLAILEAIIHGATRWTQIKTYVEYRTRTRIADKNFTNLLKKLVKYGVIEKREDQYKITDPLIEHAIKSIISQPTYTKI